MNAAKTTRTRGIAIRVKKKPASVFGVCRREEIAGQVSSRWNLAISRLIGGEMEPEGCIKLLHRQRLPFGHPARPVHCPAQVPFPIIPCGGSSVSSGAQDDPGK